MSDSKFATANASSIKVAAIVPAAGCGRRMGSSVPKQYLTLGDDSVLIHSIKALAGDARVTRVYVALAADDVWFDSLQRPLDIDVVRVTGGATRAASVAAGLQAAIADGFAYVAVHDAARPCLSVAHLTAVIDAGMTHHDGALLALPIVDTVKQIHQIDGYSHAKQTLDRNQLWLAQTPQVFSAEMLQSALQTMGLEHPDLTDEASAVEHIGARPRLVIGTRSNLKITTPEDLALAAWYLNERQRG